MVVLAQISDLHLDGTARATERAERVMRRLLALPGPLDALLVTGDITDHGTEAEYEEAARILGLHDPDPPFPVLMCPGNHDRREPYRKALLGEPPASDPVNRSYWVGEAVVVMLDSSIPGSDEGELDRGTYAWLEDTLDELDGETPVLLALHHPPVAVHHPLPDGFGLRRPARLAALIRDRPEVAGVVTGHAHSPAASVFAGRPLIVGPGVTWTLRLPWEGEDPADLDAPVGFAFHVLDDERRLTTHFRAA
ncbi:metallophosphoesterase [Streptomyces uncialis]|uniref:metallophosphoesterase n=1 Tax=Streptomyces uncialis TaxID=1048205 RepID=UPI0022574995|nr:metallophosphoesterase [Streptomyces uncialis]MCX4659495.1 metallophosphoesterase [Streptomyces uncialis]WST67578.1 metallophosphoesterase [Streptomyces uncialis]